MTVRLSHRQKPDTQNYIYQALGSSFALTGIAATLRRTWKMSIPDKIPYILSGQDVTLSPPVAPPPSGTVATLTLHPTQTGSFPYLATVYPLESAIPIGNSLVSDDDTTLRGSVISTWPDGSARVVVVSGERSVTNGSTQSINVKAGTGSGSNLTVAAIAAAVSSVVVTIPGIATGTLNSFGSPLKTWWANPRTICCRYKLALGSDMEAVIDIHAFPSGRAFVEVVVENGKVTSSSPVRPSNKTYTGATVSINGTTTATVNSATGLLSSHEAFRAWYAAAQIDSGVVTAVSGSPLFGIEVTHDTTSMQAHPAFFKTIRSGSSKTIYTSDAYSVFTTGRWPSSGMGGGGDAGQIGMLSKWDADYLQTGDKYARRGVIAAALSCLTYNINYRDSSTGVVPTSAQTSGKRISAGTWPGDAYPNAEPCWEVAHCGSVGLMAFACRPSPVFIEIAQKASMYSGVVMSTSWTWDQINYQIRGNAWAARNLAHAIMLTPDADAWKTDAIDVLYRNVQNWTTANDGTRGCLLGFAWAENTSATQGTGDFEPSVTGMQRPTIEDEYFATEVHKIANLKLFPSSQSSRQTALVAIADKAVEFPVRFVNDARLGEWRAVGSSRLTISSSASSYAFSNWGDVQAWTFSGDSGPPSISGYWLTGYKGGGSTYSSTTPEDFPAGAYYGSYFWSALVAAHERGIYGATEAYNTVVNNISNFSTWADGFSDDPRWGSTPKNLYVAGYTLPAAGQALAITATNTVESVSPYTDTASWVVAQRSGGDSYGSGDFVDGYGSAGCYAASGVGGHAAPRNIDCLIFDYHTRTWSRLANANGVTYGNNPTTTTGLTSGEFTGTQVPADCHTYLHELGFPASLSGGTSGQIVITAHLSGGYSGSDGSPYSHKFDLGSRTWSRASANVWPLGDAANESFSIFDPLTRRFYLFDGQPDRNVPYYLDPADSTWKSFSSLGSRPAVGYARIGWYDSPRRAFIWMEDHYFSGGTFQTNDRLRAIDLNNPSGGIITLTTSGAFPPASYGNRPAWYPRHKCYYAYDGTGSTLYKLTPPTVNNWKTGTWTWSTTTFTGSIQPYSTECPTRPNRHISRFVYVPKLDCLSMVSMGGTTSVSLIKPSLSSTPSFTTSFGVDENPISEGGAWTQTATAWKDVRTTAGYATGASYITEGLYDDNYAKLSTSAFSAPSDNYEVVATVRKLTDGVVANSEIEILLRIVDTSTTINCYEVLVNVGGSCELVRWNGAMGNFFEIAATSVSIPGWTGNGDKIKARVTGTNPVIVTVSHAPASNPTSFTQLFQYSDTDATRKQTGQPGIAFYAHAADNNLLNAGWQDFTVTAI